MLEYRYGKNDLSTEKEKKSKSTWVYEKNDDGKREKGVENEKDKR